MPFTEPEVNNALQKIRPGNYVSESALRHNYSPDYQPIMDYLTGKSASVPVIPVSDDRHYWSGLLNLLSGRFPLTKNDQMVINVCHIPAMRTRELNWEYKKWLLEYLLANPDEERFNFVMNEYSHWLGTTEDEIFRFWVYHSDFDKENLRLDSPWSKFLIDHYKKSDRLITPDFSSGNKKWYIVLFKMLEEAKTGYATEYPFQGLARRNDRELATFLFNYKDGFYVKRVVDSIEIDETDVYQTMPKFAAAYNLYRADKAQYKCLFRNICFRYLRNYTNYEKEGGSYINEDFLDPEEKLPGRYSFCRLSDYAFYHLLSIGEKEKVKSILAEWMHKKMGISDDVRRVLHLFMGDESFPYFEYLYNNKDKVDIYDVKRMTEILVDCFKPELYLHLLWPMVYNKSKHIRNHIAPILAKYDKDAERKAIVLLNEKGAEAKKSGALLLSHFTTPSAIEVITTTLNTEKNDIARDVLLEAVAGTLPGDASFIATTIDYAVKRGKLKKPLQDWLQEDALPWLYYKNGARLTDLEIRFLMYRMSRVQVAEVDPEANLIIDQLDREKCLHFASKMIRLLNDNNNKYELKYLMAIAAILGDDSMVDRIKNVLNKWIDWGYYYMMYFAIDSLALMGSDKAFRWLEWYSRKYKNNKPALGARAKKAFEDAAERLGLNLFELGDRIVPDLGFDGLFKSFKVGNDEYRAFIDSNFKIAFFDEDNKKLNAIPSKTSKELKDEFKAIAKEVRDVVKAQSSRLEHYMVIQRRWTSAQWKPFFTQNPIMFIYAIKFLWGIYENDQLTDTFICHEDTSFRNADGDEIELPEGQIGIVHPMQLSAELMGSWQRFFYDNSIIPIIPQLHRPAPDMSGIDPEKAIITKFEGKETKPGSIRSTLTKYGWGKGPSGDGAMLVSFILPSADQKIEAVIEVEGVSAVYGMSESEIEKLGRLYVIDTTKEGNSECISDDNAGFLVKIKDLPSIFLFEMLAAIEAIVPVGHEEEAEEEDD